MEDPLPGSKEALEREERDKQRAIAREARRQHPAAALYDPGLPLPSAVEMERCVISSLMIAPDFVSETVGGKLRAEQFSLEAHSLLYEIVSRQINEGKPSDVVSVTRLLHDMGLLEKVGGAAAVSDVATASPNPAAAEYYADQVIEKWRQRECVKHASTFLTTIMQGIEPDDLDILIGDLESSLMRISQESLNTTKGLRTGEEVALDSIGRMEFRHRNKGRILGLQWGFPDIDRRVNGFQEEDFIVIAARPAMGKTSLGTSFAQNVAINAVNGQNRPVLMFTLEMSDEQIMERSLLGMAHIAMGKGRTGLFSDAEAAVLYAAKESLGGTHGLKSADRLQDLIEISVMGLERFWEGKGKFVGKNDQQRQAMLAEARTELTPFAEAVAATASGLFSFYDGYGVTVQELRSTMRQWLRKIGWKKGCGEVPPMAVIDYLQLVKPSLKKNIGDPRLTSIEVCEALKGFAKQYGIVIVGLAQVKVNERRPDAEPQLSDIKESGAFGEYPDYVFTVHRPCYHKPWDSLKEEAKEEWDKRAGGNQLAQDASGLPDDKWGGKALYNGLTKLGIKKARHCPTDDVWVFFRGHEVRFMPITQDLYSNDPAKREQRMEVDDDD